MFSYCNYVLRVVAFEFFSNVLPLGILCNLGFFSGYEGDSSFCFKAKNSDPVFVFIAKIVFQTFAQQREISICEFDISLIYYPSIEFISIIYLLYLCFF